MIPANRRPFKQVDFFELKHSYFCAHHSPHVGKAFLGQGSFGQVIWATTPGSNERDHAVKIMPRGSEQLMKDFIHEAKMLGQLDHPRIVKMYKAGFCPMYNYIVLELHPYGTLHQHLQEFSVTRVCRFWVDIASAIQYIHEKRYIHRDVKLDNFLISSRKHAILNDFGCALWCPSDRYPPQSRFGHVRFQAPELRLNDPLPPFCPFKAEMYTVGVVFWGLMMKRDPFYHNNWLATTRTEAASHCSYMCNTIENLLNPNAYTRWNSTELMNYFEKWHYESLFL